MLRKQAEELLMKKKLDFNGHFEISYSFHRSVSKVPRHPVCRPVDHLDERQKTEAEAQSHETTDLGDEAGLRHPGFPAELEDRGLLEVEGDDGDVLFVGVVRLLHVVGDCEHGRISLLEGLGMSSPIVHPALIDVMRHGVLLSPVLFDRACPPHGRAELSEGGLVLVTVGTGEVARRAQSNVLEVAGTKGGGGHAPQLLRRLC